MDRKITIILPVYNVQTYLPQCLDSVLAQTYSDWEALLIDDGSTDRSGTICDEYAGKDPRFRVFHKENGGAASAKNLGLDYAAGADYDHALSLQLTRDTVTANLKVRDLGFKPYLAPGLSSAAISVLRTLRGEYHDGAMALGGIYFGCRLRSTTLGVQPERTPLHPRLLERMQEVYDALRGFDYDG